MMTNDKFKRQNRNPYDLVRNICGEKFDIFRRGFGSERLYDHRISDHSRHKAKQKDGEE